MSANPSNIATRLANAPRELKLFAIASLVMGMSYSMMDSTFNNFLNERFALSGFQRSFLEFPRELPGLLTVFVTALLWFLCSRRLGAWSLVMGVVGTLLVGFAAPSYWIMVVWLFIYSLGQHLFMPVAAGIGMELAHEGKTGQRLGQLNAIRNLAAILGSFTVFVGFRYLGFTFRHTFVLIAVGLGIAAVLMFSMKRGRPQPAASILKLRREYRLYYLLAVLYGSRKQLFITFAPWVLVTIFQQPTSTLATLITIGGIIGIMFQPLLGWMIDHFGERVVLVSEAVLLVFVCIGYGFSKFIFPESTAFLVVCACYLLDNMLMSVSMARSTYIKKIVQDISHLQPALTASVTIDHVFSISVALLGGLVWSTYGFQYVFLMGALIAVINFFAAMQVRVPKAAAETGVEARPVQP
jgi:predicted MFS family arabinose efflux permease